MTESEVLLGLGANQGSPLDQLREAVERLGKLIELDAVSSVYRSEPVGYREQPDFYNLVCRGRTRLPAGELLRQTQQIEDELGRRRTFRNAPRTIDIDLLAVGDLMLDTPELVLPHPRLHERAFVLVPLREIAPDWRHPRSGRTAAELLSEGAGLERVEHWGDLRREP